jgi:hypothetical protein
VGVVHEALQNAKDAVRRTGEAGHIEVELDVGEQSVTVKDSGVGFPPDQSLLCFGGTDKDEDRDWGLNAQQFKLSGGGIRNCSLAAAFMAADDRGKIGMRQIVRAVALQYGKLGRLTLESDFERFHELIRPGGNGERSGPHEPTPEDTRPLA